MRVDSRVRETGRMMYLRAPKPMVSLSEGLIGLRYYENVLKGKKDDEVRGNSR